MDYINKFKSRLKQLRDEKKLSQTELADIVGISRGSISFYEKGERQPDIETVYKMAQYFNVTSDYLLGLSDGTTHDIGVLINTIGLDEQTIKVLKTYAEDTKMGFCSVFTLRTINKLIKNANLIDELNTFLYHISDEGIVTINEHYDSITPFFEDMTKSKKSISIAVHLNDDGENATKFVKIDNEILHELFIKRINDELYKLYDEIHDPNHKKMNEWLRQEFKTVINERDDQLSGDTNVNETE